MSITRREAADAPSVRHVDRKVPMTPRILASLVAATAVTGIVWLTAVPAGGQAAAGSARAAAAKVACADLIKLPFEGNTTITAATSVPAGTFMTPAGQTLTDLPAFCRVGGVAKPTSDSDINFEVWLPSESWNRKFVSSGEGGFAGALNYTRRGLDGGLEEWLKRG